MDYIDRYISQMYWKVQRNKCGDCQHRGAGWGSGWQWCEKKVIETRGNVWCGISREESIPIIGKCDKNLHGFCQDFQRSYDRIIAHLFIVGVIIGGGWIIYNICAY